MTAKHCIAVVSPFVDKRHGTERCVAEQVEGLAGNHGYEVHLYSERVEDIAGLSGRGSAATGIVWHRVPAIPGPQLLRYVWWVAANQMCRWLNTAMRGCHYDLIFSPGINCLDADVVAVHMVFAEFVQAMGPALHLKANPWRAWPRLIHRRLCYALYRFLERRTYGRTALPVVAVSQKTARDLARFYQRENAAVLYHGLDHNRFCPGTRETRRPAARAELGLAADDFNVILIGNDWRKKGLHTLIEAMARLGDSAVRLLVVGEDDAASFAPQIEQRGLTGRVRFAPPRNDVEFYYAAADLYAGPSLEDAFALPPAEAMACGLPVIVSRAAGVSEIVTHGENALVVENPADAEELARCLAQIRRDPALARALGENAARSMQQYTWARNVEQLKSVLEAAMKRKGRMRQAVEQPN